MTTPQVMLNRKSYQASKPEMEFHMMNIIYAALSMRAQTEKTTFSCKDDCTLTKHTRRWTYSALRYFLFGDVFPFEKNTYCLFMKFKETNFATCLIVYFVQWTISNTMVLRSLVLPPPPLLYTVYTNHYSKRFPFSTNRTNLTGFQNDRYHGITSTRKVDKTAWYIASLGSILDSQLSWESGKFQLARWSHTVALLSDRIFFFLLQILREPIRVGRDKFFGMRPRPRN